MNHMSVQIRRRVELFAVIIVMILKIVGEIMLITIRLVHAARTVLIVVIVVRVAMWKQL